MNNSKKQKNTYLYLNIDKKHKLKYGNLIKIVGKYEKPGESRNYGGFNYQNFLKTLDIYGTVNATNLQILQEQKGFQINTIFNEIRENIKVSASKYLDERSYSIFLGLILGDTSNIEDDIKEQFRDSSMSHVLAVSGMHISYIIFGISILLNKAIGKQKTKIITIIILIIYVLITGFSPSILRASIMGIVILLSGILHRKSDTWNSIAISLFVVLIYNPYLITSVSLQFTYAGTIGIIMLNKIILKVLNKNNSNKSKIKEIIAVSIASQVFILPISILHFNTFGIYFLITNILLSLIICPTIILCFIFLVVLIFNCTFAKLVAIVVNIFIQLVLLISNFSFLPLSRFYIKTPTITEICLYYVAIIFMSFIFTIKKKRKPSTSNLRVLQTLEVLKFKIRTNKKKCLRLSLGTMLLIALLIAFIPHNLKIHFVDVGQGDCCFIETPNSKSILIDGGGSEFSSFDVGKSTLLPYILDRGYTKIDYIFISHFDTDHVGGLLTVMEELDVGKVFISNQGTESENYKKFKQIVNKKKIKVVVVGKGDKIKINNDLYFDIIWPNNSKLISENVLNNNSIVCKLNYKNFSLLFTGDIEEIAEKQILQEYKENLEVFNSTILKVGHHGSKTSSIQKFLDVVKPKIALIGVGENNKFGHPNDEVLERIKKIRYRNLSYRPKWRNFDNCK